MNEEKEEGERGENGTDVLNYGKTSHDMKIINSVVLVLVVGALFFANAKHITAGYMGILIER